MKLISTEIIFCQNIIIITIFEFKNIDMSLGPVYAKIEEFISCSSKLCDWPQNHRKKEKDERKQL